LRDKTSNIRVSMAKSRPLLERLLNAPDLTRIVPHLQPDVLHRVIQICGLEDCADVVALATPDQLARILDVDIWRARPGGDEEFDVDRFGVWLEVLMQSGAPVAAQKLVGLDIELVIAGFARHTKVFDHLAVSSYTTLDGDQVPGRVLNHQPVCEIGGYLIEARRTSAWDAIVDLLVFLHSEHPEYFGRLMRGCVQLSNGTREADGFYNLLPDRDQDMFDLACDREARREKQGYITPAQARAFLLAARQLEPGGDQAPQSPVARAYFRAIEPTPAVAGDPSGESDGALPGTGADAVPAVEADAIDGVVDVLRDEGVLTEQPRALLAAAGATSRLAAIQAYVASRTGAAEELAYLANTIIAGCSIQGRPFTTREASDAAVAICNLGLENWPARWGDRDLVAVFQVGWAVLHRDVCLFVATRLIDVIAGIRCADRDIQLRLHALRRELTQHVQDGAPWRARNALDVIVMLDAPAWATLLALIDECPVMHAAIGASRHSSRAINAEAFEFISENSQVAVVREFVASLPSTLTC
jgi:hypothetical protein